MIPLSPDAGRTWPERFGLAVDRLLNVVLFNGDDTWTVSLHAAVARRQGKRWGCWACAVLGVLVQRDHCAVTLDPALQETTGAALRAGALMTLLIAALTVGLRYIIEITLHPFS